MIIDDEVIISTWNLTYSTFAFNRDFFLFINDKNILNKILVIFQNDFVWKSFIEYDDNLLLSPFYAKQKFEKLFKLAQKSITMYFQYLEFDELENILIQQAKKWIEIKIIVSKNFYEKNKNKIWYLTKNNIKITTLKKEKMHAKAILIDNKVLFIWSQNFSFYSLEKNRELWIIVKNYDIIKKFNHLYKNDFTNN
jgi:phosphatidylserine/phosphatidylglycerophosphate/cardiolipin synthase-like enzyme